MTYVHASLCLKELSARCSAVLQSASTAKSSPEDVAANHGVFMPTHAIVGQTVSLVRSSDDRKSSLRI
jgi:hypothetical protein